VSAAAVHEYRAAMLELVRLPSELLAAGLSYPACSVVPFEDYWIDSVAMGRCSSPRSIAPARTTAIPEADAVRAVAAPGGLRLGWQRRADGRPAGGIDNLAGTGAPGAAGSAAASAANTLCRHCSPQAAVLPRACRQVGVQRAHFIRGYQKTSVALRQSS
jgi:hypothetical protein